MAAGPPTGIAFLAARSLSDERLAAHLVVSVRMAECQLYMRSSVVRY